MYSVWQEVKDRLAIEDVIQEYIPVQTQGSVYKALCPFHREKSPSLVINSEKKIWHCFGCGAGGDIFAFVTQIENITKKEVLTKLAKKAGVELKKTKEYSDYHENSDPEQEKVSIGKFEQGLKLLEWTSEVYYKILLRVLQDRENPITKYCLERGLTQEIIDEFKLGYAPRGNMLLSLAQKYNLNTELMLDIGVFKEKEQENQNAKLSDKFSDRLMIPVFDRQGRVVGFTGRVLPYDKTERPKYLNSPQSIWFNKSDLWFGLHLARTHILQTKAAIIVEGNMDVVGSFKAGFKNTLASQGTSFTENQLKILKNVTKNIQVAFDNDEAGIISSDKLFKAATMLGFNVQKVVIPTQYKDLDEFLSIENPKELNITEYLTWMLSRLNMELKSGDLNTQKEAIHKVVDLLEVLDPVSREHYLKKLSEISGVSFSVLDSLVKDNTLEIKPDNTEDNDKGLSLEQSVYLSWENLLAATLSIQPEFIENIAHSFELLKPLLPQLDNYSSFGNYLEENTEIMAMIIDEKKELLDLNQRQSMWSTVIHYLDSKLISFALDENLKNLYLKLKSAKL